MYIAWPHLYKILDIKKSTIVTERISVCLGNAECQTEREGHDGGITNVIRVSQAYTYAKAYHTVGL